MSDSNDQYRFGEDGNLEEPDDDEDDEEQTNDLGRNNPGMRHLVASDEM